MVTPIASDDGGVQAALVFAMLADEELTTVLDTVRIGDAGENYVFVGDQIVLSSQHKPEELSHLSEQLETPAPNSPLATSVPVAPRASVRTEGSAADAESASPLVVLPEADAQGKLEVDPDAADPEVTDPAVTDPAEADPAEEASREPLHWNLKGYRNYCGQEVIAAWQWLPQHGFGVATEVSKPQAYAPLAYVTKSFRWLFSTISLLTLATFLATLSVAHLRNRALTSQKLGPYTLQSLIGQGGMGKVYRAQHALLRRPTAVKLLEGEHADPASVQRFEREVQLTSQLTHPNTIQIYDFGRSLDGVFYYAMEFLEGPTLAKLVAMDFPIPVARTVHILHQVCGSLREAHRQGLVHRDIKPQNIMLCCRGGMYDFVKVLDFGLVKQFADASDQLTRAATISGTPAYIAPERVDSPDTLDGRSDLYSLGAVAFYLLTGQEVFQGKTAVDVLVRALHDDAPRPSSRTTVVPAALDDLVVRCLQKEPSERPETVDDVLHTLDSIAEAAPWSASQAQAWWEEHWIGQQLVDSDGTDGATHSVKQLPARH